METIVIDFKRPMKPNSELTNKNDLVKSKDFLSTLESINKKINSKDSSQNISKPNDDKENIVSKKEGMLKENNDIDSEQIKDDEKKDCSLLYGNIMYFFNNVTDIEDGTKNNEEIQLSAITGSKDLVLEEKLGSILVTDDETDEILQEHIAVDPTMKKDEVNKEIDNKELDLTYVAKEIDDDVQNNKTNNKEIQPNSKILQNEIDEENNVKIITANENNLSNIKELDEKMEFSSEEKNNSKSSLFKQKVDTDDVEKTDKNIKNYDEAFISMDKNGIRYIKDNSIVELDKPDTVNSKEIMEQIVEKFKIDLSDAKNEIKVKLKPEVLGEMTMNIEVVKGAVTAKIMVDNQRTKEIIEGNLIQLKEGIKDTGLEIKTFEVFVGNNSDFDKHSSGQFNLKQNNKKVKLKSQDNKSVKVYGEQPIENEGNINEEYLENSLNLFA